MYCRYPSFWSLTKILPEADDGPAVKPHFQACFARPRDIAQNLWPVELWVKSLNLGYLWSNLGVRRVKWCITGPRLKRFWLFNHGKAPLRRYIVNRYAFLVMVVLKHPKIALLLNLFYYSSRGSNWLQLISFYQNLVLVAWIGCY